MFKSPTHRVSKISNSAEGAGRLFNVPIIRLTLAMTLVVALFATPGRSEPAGAPATRPAALKEPIRLGNAERGAHANIAGQYVAFCPDPYGQVIYDLTTQKKILETKDNYPTRVSGHTAVWARGVDLAGSRLDRKSPLLIKPVGKNLPGNLRIDSFPCLWEDWVGFVHFETATKKRFIFAYNNKTKKLLGPLSKNYDIQGFELNGGIVVWGDSDPNARGIHLYDLATDTDVIISTSGSRPATDGRTVVWTRGQDVVAYDIHSKQTATVGKGTTAQVDGDWIVWAGSNADGQRRVFGYHIPSKQTVEVTAKLPEREKIWYHEPMISGSNVVLTEVDFKTDKAAVWVVPLPTLPSSTQVPTDGVSKKAE